MEDNLVTQSWNRGHPQPTTCACLAATISSKKITSKTSNAKLLAQCIPPVSCSRKVSSRLPHTPLTTIQVKYQGHGYPGQRHGRLIPSHSSWTSPIITRTRYNYTRVRMTVPTVLRGDRASVLGIHAHGPCSDNLVSMCGEDERKIFSSS